jgi:heme-degrading monooxygenase HmoA
MIARHWRALARNERADEYVNHLRTEIFPEIRKIAGNLGAGIHRRDVANGVEFVIVTRWVSEEAIRAFAGADVEVAVVPTEVREMMLEYDLRARHYHIIE